MKNNNCNLKKTLERYFEKRICIEDENNKFDQLMLHLDNQYKLSNIYDFNVNLVVDKENNNKFCRFEYTLDNEDYYTTIYIYFVNDTNLKNLGIVFDEITIGEKDYPYGKTTAYLLDGTIVTKCYDYNGNTDAEKKDNYIKKLIKI